MPEKLKEISPPTGFARLAFRAPIWLYRFGLGRLLGHRFLLLTHTGRKSGLARHTALEVVRCDRQTGENIVAAGFGGESDWVKNIIANPSVEVQSAGKKVRAAAVPLTPQEAGEELVRYAHQHPLAFRELVRFMGYQVDGTDADIHALGENLHMFALRPVNTGSKGPDW